MITAHLFSASEHYETVCDWWKKSGWQVPMPLTHLPQVGIVVCLNDLMACAGWLYQTDSAFCWFDFVVANPEVRKQERTECLSYLINEAKRVAQNMGYRTIIHSVKNASLISRLEKEGFVATEKNMTNLTFNIHGGF